MNTQNPWLLGSVLSVFVCTSCGEPDRDQESNGGDSNFTTTGFDSGMTQGGDTSTTGSSDAGGTSGPKLDMPVSTSDTSDPTDGECASVTETADNQRQPADIVWVIDNSGSMTFEVEFVQANINAFSEQIIASGVDVQVALLSSYPGSGQGICVDPPLGSGGCPSQDSNPPRFVHIASEIGSSNALPKLLELHEQWKPSMRPTASKHFVVISDDESRDMDAPTFDATLRALDPSYAEYTFHAIVSPEDPITACLNLSICCAYASWVGQVYINLVESTGGVLGNLCEQDFQPVFDRLSTAIVTGSKLSCEWDIPEPPNDMEFDPGKVNVEFEDAQGNKTSFGKVSDPSQCASVSNGWYYDDPVSPTKILVCPQTCEEIQGVAEAKINIKFGCASDPAE